MLLGIGMVGVIAAALLLTLPWKGGVPSKVTFRTLMLVRYDIPYPWPSGNHFNVLPRWRWLLQRHLPWLDRYLPRYGWRVINMHHENYREIARRKGIEWVNVEPVGTGKCLVVDSRIPRRWLLPRAEGLPLTRRLRLKKERPECFSIDQQAEGMIDTAWVLADREDPDGMLQKYLPGDRIEFDAGVLRCKNAAGAVIASRTWEWTTHVARSSLAIYDNQGDLYTGLAGQVLHDDNILTFNVKSFIERTTESRSSKTEEGCWVRYKRAGTSSPTMRN
jgi:hypothetical protein